MEKEKTKKEITIRSNMTQMIDLGTDNPNLEIELKSSGPARVIEYCTSENGARAQWMQRLESGETKTFRLGQAGKGKFLLLVNNEFEATKITAIW